MTVNYTFASDEERERFELDSIHAHGDTLADHETRIDTLETGGGDSEHNGSGADSTQVGTNAVSSGAETVSLGDNALAAQDGGVALGVSAVAGYYGVSIGNYAQYNDNDSVRSVIIGESATLPRADHCVGIGLPEVEGSNQGPFYMVLLGMGAVAADSAESGVAIGRSLWIGGQYNVVLGRGAGTGDSTTTPVVSSAVVVGDTTQALGSHAVAIGHSVLAAEEDSVAIGHSATASHERSVALGEGSATTATDQIMLGHDANDVVSLGDAHLAGAAGVFGAFGQPGTTRPTVTGSRGGNAALASLLTALAGLGWIVDGTSA